MLEDFGENPSVSLNELNIRIAAMGALSSENRKLLKDKCIKYADLYSIQTERVLKDEYNGLDNYQKELMLLNIQNMKNLISLIEKFNI